MKKETKSIPENLEELFENVRSQVTLLHGWWIIYRQLFGTSRERVDFLNECASSFFYITQDALWDGIQLILSKLSDPAQTFGKKNLSLEMICQVIKELGQEELFSDLDKSLSSYRKKCEIFKKHRNKRIAHFDFDTLINGKSKPLPGVSRAMIEDALKELRFFMNQVDGFYRDTEMGYEYFKMPDDAEALIEIIKRGLRYEELCRDGKVEIMDLEKSKYYKA